MGGLDGKKNSGHRRSSAKFVIEIGHRAFLARAARRRRIVQTGNKRLSLQIAKWVFLAAGVLGAFYSFVAWFLVPGIVDLNRLVVAGLFASLTINALLLSGIFFRESSEDGFGTLQSVFRTPPIVILVLFLTVFAGVTATAPLWGKH
jgi:hypothetical protein